MSQGAPHILILGGGYLGLYTARAVERHLAEGEAAITLVNPESFMVYEPFLPEAASGSIEPRHVVVPLRKALNRTRLVVGRATGMDPDRRVVTIQPLAGPLFELGYDHVVIAVGSVSRVLQVPGLRERAVGFKSIGEAIYLRNQVLSCLDAAESSQDARVRSRALTFLFVGGGYTGVEALAELEDLARDACVGLRSVRRADMRWVLVEATARILPELDASMSDHARRILEGRAIEIHTGTRLESAVDGLMRLSDGATFEAETLVWTTGVRPHPLVAKLGVPLDERGRIRVDAYLRVERNEGVWAAGDCAAVPDLTTGGLSPPTAQHALRQARRLGANLAATLRGQPPAVFRYRNLGTLVSLGRYKGVARVVGVRVHGFAAWFLHRSYHLSRLPTFGRKVRVAVDWTVALFFKRDIVQLGTLTRPRDAFTEAMGDDTQLG